MRLPNFFFFLFCKLLRLVVVISFDTSIDLPHHRDFFLYAVILYIFFFYFCFRLSVIFLTTFQSVVFFFSSLLLLLTCVHFKQGVFASSEIHQCALYAVIYVVKRNVAAFSLDSPFFNIFFFPSLLQNSIFNRINLFIYLFITKLIPFSPPNLFTVNVTREEINKISVSQQPVFCDSLNLCFFSYIGS